MGSLSDTYECNVLDAILGAGFTKDATVYIALCTSAPTDSAVGAEPSGNNYSRLSQTNNATNWPNASTSGGVTTKKNGVDVIFAAPSGSWGTITHFMVMNHATGTAMSNMIAWGVLGASRAITTGSAPHFPINSLVITSD